LEKALKKMKERKEKASIVAYGHNPPLNPFMVSLRRIINISWIIL